MNKHYLLDTEDLYRQAVREIKDDAPVAIRAAIKMLLSKKILFDGAAMTRDEVLDNDTRHRIFEMICNRPGIYFSRIKTFIDTDSRTLLFHLNVLGRFGFVRSEQINNNKAYYEISSPREFDLLYHYLQRDGARDIFKAILENQFVSMEDLITILKGSTSRQALKRKIKILLDKDLISGKVEANKLISLNIQSCYRDLVKKVLLKA